MWCTAFITEATHPKHKSKMGTLVILEQGCPSQMVWPLLTVLLPITGDMKVLPQQDRRYTFPNHTGKGSHTNIALVDVLPSYGSASITCQHTLLGPHHHSFPIHIQFCWFYFQVPNMFCDFSWRYGNEHLLIIPDMALMTEKRTNSS